MSVSPGSAPIRNSALRLTRRGLIQSSAAAALIGVQGVSAQDATPAASPAYDALLAEARTLRGRAAEDAYRRAIDANPNGSEALADLALMLLERGRMMEAKDLSQRATVVDPTNSKAWITFASALDALGERDAARAAYRTCAERGQGRYVGECRRFAR